MVAVVFPSPPPTLALVIIAHTVHHSHCPAHNSSLIFIQFEFCVTYALVVLPSTVASLFPRPYLAICCLLMLLYSAGAATASTVTDISRPAAAPTFAKAMLSKCAVARMLSVCTPRIKNVGRQFTSRAWY